MTTGGRLSRRRSSRTRGGDSALAFSLWPIRIGRVRGCHPSRVSGAGFTLGHTRPSECMALPAWRPSLLASSRQSASCTGHEGRVTLRAPRVLHANKSVNADAQGRPAAAPRLSLVAGYVRRYTAE